MMEDHLLTQTEIILKSFLFFHEQTIIGKSIHFLKCSDGHFGGAQTWLKQD